LVSIAVVGLEKAMTMISTLREPAGLPGFAALAQGLDAGAPESGAPTRVADGGRKGLAVSLAFHGLALAAVYFACAHAPLAPPRSRTIELTLTRLAPAPPTVTPLVERPREAVPVQRARPVAPVQRVPVAAAPVRSAVAPPVAQSVAPGPVATAPPAAPVAAPPAAPAATTAAPAPPEPVAAKPRVVDTNGIPSDYVNKVFERIDRYAADSYPRAARLRHDEGRVGYQLTLDPEGRVLAIDIRSSGNATLDDAARDAIRSAAPFPKPPDLGAGAYRLAGTIAYELTD
jgi:periplasmic protein TonB